MPLPVFEMSSLFARMRLCTFSEDNFGESFLSLHHVGPEAPRGDQAQGLHAYLGQHLRAAFPLESDMVTTSFGFQDSRHTKQVCLPPSYSSNLLLIYRGAEDGAKRLVHVDELSTTQLCPSLILTPLPSSNHRTITAS